jgi:hypothetical protein
MVNIYRDGNGWKLMEIDGAGVLLQQYQLRAADIYAVEIHQFTPVYIYIIDILC